MNSDLFLNKKDERSKYAADSAPAEAMLAYIGESSFI
jgi:hypothetical protein